MTSTQVKENKVNGTCPTMLRMYNVGEHYKIIDEVGRGTYGTVYKAKGLKDGRCYGIKKLENNCKNLQQQGFPITALRGTFVIVPEITLLKQIDHPNIIKLKEIVVSKPSKRNLYRGSTFLVFEYMHHDFAGLFKAKVKYSLPEIKCIIRQLIEGIAYLHRNKILHRDIKSANILVNDEGEVKLADFGLGRKIRFENMFTYKVVTLWYRAPQLLLGLKAYSDKIDIWSLGCVVAEFFTGEVMFKKQTQYAQMERIYELVGDFEANGIKITDESYKTYQNLQDLRPRKSYPKEIEAYLKKLCPTITQTTIDFIERLLHLDPSKRMSCEQALRHPFFSQKPLPCSKNEMQKMQYQCHEMFKDRSIKIERILKKQLEAEDRIFSKKYEKDSNNFREKRAYESREHHRSYEKRQGDDHKYQRQDQYKERREYGDNLPPKDAKYRDDRYPRENRKVVEKRHRSSDNSSENNSNSESSSSYSSYSSSGRSPRSRYDSHRPRDARMSRDRLSRDRSSRPEYPRKDRSREESKKYERRQHSKYHQHYERLPKDDRYYRHEDDKRYNSYRDERKRHEEDDRRRDYRVDDRHQLHRKDDIARKDDVVRKDELLRKQERSYQRKDDYERPSQKRASQIRSQKRDDKRDDKRDYHDRKDEWHRGSTQHRSDRYQRGRVYESTKERKHYDDRDKHYQERDYKRREERYGREEKYGRQEKYVRGEDKYVRGEDKYKDYQKGGRDEFADKRSDKYYFVSGKHTHKKKDGRSVSSERSSHQVKRDKDYGRRQSKPYPYQHKPYYKKQHQGSLDHRSNH